MPVLYTRSQVIRQQTDLLSNIIEPAMLLITGLMTGSIVIGMYLPMFNPGEAIF
ncbi:hypothetical protein GCM10009414_03580 [Tatumella terrea]|uniref:hypothetical protein n=1 Tax=Tatumella terrea TaxID=419007 RepID=UPI0031D359CF